MSTSRRVAAVLASALPLWGAAGEGAAFSVDDALQGAQAELADYGMERAEWIETRVQELPINWKLVVDTFTETYHIATLHKKSIGPHYHTGRWIIDPNRNLATDEVNRSSIGRFVQ